MQFTRFDRSARALRLLSLSSAVLLAACGGGGGSDGSDTTGSSGGDSVQAPADPAPTGPTLAAGVDITATNKQAVAADAGGVVSTLNPQMSFFQFFSVIPNAVAVQTQVAPGAATAANPTAILAAATRKFAKSARQALAAGVTTTEQVDCTSGSGTITDVAPDDTSVSTYDRSLTVVLQSCKTTLDVYGEVTMNGTLKITGTGIESQNVAYDVLATQYSMKGDGVETLLDGDMRLEASYDGSTETAVVSGKKFTTSFIGSLGALATAAAAQPTQRTVTLSDYRQSMKYVDGQLQVDTSATVETNSFGDMASYVLTTPQTLVSGSSGYISGKLQIVGASGTILWITANGDGTFKLERDDKGDGSIDDTLTPVQASDLNLVNQVLVN